LAKSNVDKSNKSTKSVSKFIAWIDDIGIEPLAEKLGIDPSAVSHWRRGHCHPQVRHMKKIVELSKGKLTYQEIIEGVPR